MTNTEKQLSTDLHSKLGVKQEVKLNRFITAEFNGSQLVITDKYSKEQTIYLRPNEFLSLVKFSEQIGWQCD